MALAPSITLTGAAQINFAPLFGPLSLVLEPGQWTCLLGASGVGKSTILRLIAGLETGATFDGQITSSDNLPIPPRVAYMAQSDLLMPWADVASNVALGARLRQEPVDVARRDAILAATGLADHAGKKPHELSGGERQRVALARTLMEDKPIVLLDEPFSALDAGTRADMQELAYKLLDGRTVLLVTHDPAEAARLGQKIAVMFGAGLSEVVPPSSPAPRKVDDAETLSAQAQLLNHLRGQAA